jgi:hypothetical protein
MDQFKKVYWPGGMSLDHSCWMLVKVGHDSLIGTFYTPLRRLGNLRPYVGKNLTNPVKY